MVKITLILIILPSSFTAFSECCVTCFEENEVHDSQFVGDDCSKEDDGHTHPIANSSQTLSCNCNCIPKITSTFDNALVIRESFSAPLTHFDHNFLKEAHFHQSIFHPPIS